MTWEPEENLAYVYAFLPNASECYSPLQDCYRARGGLLHSDWRPRIRDRRSREGAGEGQDCPPRKRGRAASGNGVTPKGKRGKLEKHLKSTTPPASLDFKPPTGSWENEAMTIEQIEEEDDGTLTLNIVGREDTEWTIPQGRCTSAVYTR